MKITKIERAKKNKLRVNIFTDGEYLFSVYEDVFLKMKIETGMDIDESFVEKAKKSDMFESNKHYLLNILSRKNYTEKELYNKLFLRKVDKETSTKLLNSLKKMGFLNDEKYMRDYFSFLIDAQKYSKQEILYKMKMKFREDDKIMQIEEWLKEYDERSVLLNMVKNRAQKLDEKKVMAYFARKGFRYDDILNAFRKLKKEE